MDLTTREGRKQQGQKIQRAAEDAGVSLEELARQIGCSRALLYQYVSGIVLAQSSRLQKIARQTGKPLTFFFEEEPGPVGEAAGPRAVLDRADPPADQERDLAPVLEEETSIASGDHTVPPAREEIQPPAAVANPADGSYEVARLSLRYLEQLALVLEKHDESQELLTTCERILPYARQVQDRAAEARAWLRIGNARIQRGYPDLALQALQLALLLAEELGDAALILSCRQSLGHAALSTGDTDRAMAEFRRVASGPDWSSRWQGLISEAAVYEHCGDLRAAMAGCEAALDALQQAPGAPRPARERARTYIISNQANVFLACGDFRGAGALSRELLLSAERAGQREQFVEALINLGICQIYSGEWDQADENLLRAVDLAHFSGDTPRWGFARAWRASLLVLMGDPEAAKEEAKDAHRLGLETGSRRCEIQAQISLGNSYLRTGSPREAIYHFRDALRAANQSFTAAQVALAQERCARAMFQSGAVDEARDLADQVVSQAREIGMEHLEAMAQDLLARVILSSGDVDGAFRLADEAFAAAGRLGLAELRWRSGALTADLLERQQWGETPLQYRSEAIRVLTGLRARTAARRGEEALLEDPDALHCYRAQAALLRQLGRDEEASRLLEEANWPLLTPDL